MGDFDLGWYAIAYHPGSILIKYSQKAADMVVLALELTLCLLGDVID